ncbi:hypothetical protein KBY17_34570 [Streptomyces sp. RK75]|nr:hypothetical protein [Streptomyces sp. RK75]
MAGADGVEGGRVVVRPSGTEPKLKCYLEVVVPVRVATDLATARKRAAAVLEQLKGDLKQATGL